MRLLAHLSDVHFGREDGEIVDGLLRALRDTRPDLIVVSGDLTQRARKSQFRQAKEFLDALPQVPRLVVPGNHDISATNLIDRMAHPLRRYRRWITPDLSPFLNDPEVAVAGINTVRLLARKDGRINRSQVALACEQLGRAAPGALRVVVTHHPMDLPAEDGRHAVVSRSRMAMEAFSRCRVDLFLSGHLHTGQTVVSSRRYGRALRDGTRRYAAVVAHAGTAVSTRTRGEANAWNLIRVDAGRMTVGQMVWDPGGKTFVPGAGTAFERGSDGWWPSAAPHPPVLWA